MNVLHFKYKSLGPCETFIERQLRLFRDSEDIQADFLYIKKTPNELSCPIDFRSGWFEYIRLFFLSRKKLPDLIHAHFGSNALLILILTLFRKLPLIVSFYGHDVGSFPKKNMGLNHFLYHFLFKYCQTVVAMTETMREQLIALGCSPEKIRQYFVGVDPLKSRNRHSSSLKNLLMVSSLRPKKNHALVLRAIADLKFSDIDLELKIIGDGPCRNELEELTSKLNLSDQVKFIGHISDREELSKYYQWADLMLHPSCIDHSGDQEGLPSSIVEAFSTGIAVVLSDHVGLRQIFSESGLYTDPHNEKELAKIIRSLYDCPKLLQNLERQSSQIYAKSFAANKNFEPLIDLYFETSV
ncbi:MAG: glycosyltransferase family 4 protein [bacterium]|nr:glycosyltransferase family 4 protein [bacterium]